MPRAKLQSRTYHMAQGKGLFGWDDPNQELVCSSPHSTIRPSVNVRHLGQALETYWRNSSTPTQRRRAQKMGNRFSLSPSARWSSSPAKTGVR
jgi:hypothetical protein